MSKSDESDYSRINLQDSEDEIIKKIKKQKPIHLNLYHENRRFKK